MLSLITTIFVSTLTAFSALFALYMCLCSWPASKLRDYSLLLRNKGHQQSPGDATVDDPAISPEQNTHPSRVGSAS